MIITFSGKSRPSAERIALAGERITLIRGYRGTINWGRNEAATILNPNISNSTNKRIMRELFKEHGVPMPELVSWSDLGSDLARGIARKVVGRPDRHMKGRGFWLIDSFESFLKASRGTRRKAAATHFMEYIDAPHEYRVHIFKGQSIRISEKLFADGGYTTIKPTGRVYHVRKAAKKAVEALGLDFGAVDVLALEDGTPFVLEVNAAPGLGGTMPKVWAETFIKWERGEL